MNEPRYRDKHGVREVWGVSDATRHRASQRAHDPFPRGKLINGKRFWDLQPEGEVMQWLARQDDPPPRTPAFVKTEPSEAEPVVA